MRGLHYQVERPQGKLVRVVSGEVLDVAVDLRKKSPTFGKWVSELLSEDNKKQLWIPEGFAHGFLTLSDSAQLLYKTTDFYFPEFDRSILWKDKFLNIDWGIESPLISEKDNAACCFRDADFFS